MEGTNVSWGGTSKNNKGALHPGKMGEGSDGVFVELFYGMLCSA